MSGVGEGEGLGLRRRFLRGGGLSAVRVSASTELAWIETLGCGNDSGDALGSAASGVVAETLSAFASGVAPSLGPTK